MNHVSLSLHQEHCMNQTMCPRWTNQLYHHSLKDTMITYMAQPRCSLNSQVLAIFFPFTITPAMPHYQNSLIGILLSMVGYRFHCISWLTFFSTFLTQLPPSFSITRLVQYLWATIPGPTGKILEALPPPFLSHSPDSGCIGAQKITSLGRS